MGYMQEYKQKLKTPEEAAKVVKNGDWVDYGFGLNMPDLFDKELAKRKEELKDIKVRGLLSLRPIAVVECDPQRETFTYNSWHMSGYERKLHDKGLCNYIPMTYRYKPALYRNHLDVNVACICVSPMDNHGYFSFSFSNSATKAILDKADFVILEINEQHPKVFGGQEECVHISEVDMIIEGPHDPPAELPAAAVTEDDIKVANLVVSELVDGATIQLGIGGMPKAIGDKIAESDLKDLGMHTEMLVDSYLDMYKNGRLTNRRKNIDKNKGVWSICMGSKDLYEWIAENSGLASYPIDYVNSPDNMSKNDNLMTINNCIEVDLFGQTCAESSGIRNISGSGGQLDFLTGGFMSKGGKSFICMRSTFFNKKTNQLESRIVPTLPAGGIVTDPRSQAYYLVTEWGIKNLAGRSTWERAEAIISLAHPDFRDKLIHEAESMNIWRYSNRR